ncbi:MAPEG family protein [Sulfitobacter sp. THAF37]|uniref:MAPEG family protein n=1 Tax=Sulfitobacter sp. THAF37 TaxID=2587855 RepID=UPI0012694337|nr:MAPEG family protein [Sulfitobacter sp. THAF37]QFT60278.1 MAPEG family protein [Sulfitobacter sp. THAF37]
MAGFEAYGHAIMSLALWSVVSIVLGMIATRGKTAENTCACGHPKRDYSNVVYRRGRAFANAMEMSGPFIGATVAAILAGANPFWVNLLAAVFLVSRVAVAAVHIGTEIQPLRSAVWMVGFLCVLGLVGMAVWTVL